MPFRVKIKITSIVLTLVILIYISFEFHFLLGLLLSLLALLIGEMYNPRWNFFGPCILDVKKFGAKKICLSFDDGPSEYTAEILKILKEKQVKANFFFLGANIDRLPEIARQAALDGHQIGLHGYSHTKMHFKGIGFIRAELDACVAAFERNKVPYSTLFRFPHGLKNFFGVKELQTRSWKLCGWGRGVWDSKKPGTQVIVERALKLKEFEILLLHDGDGSSPLVDRSQTREALPAIIEGLRGKGFEFVTLDAP